MKKKQPKIRYEDGRTVVWQYCDDEMREVHYDSDRQAILALAQDYSQVCREWRRLQAAIARLNATANDGPIR